MDKRVERTRRVIRETLLSLMGEKPLGQITTTELCREAHINRNTFYAHYKAPEEVVREIEDELIEELLAADRLGYERKDVTLYVCRYIARKQELFRALWRCKASRLLDRAIDILLQESLIQWQVEGLRHVNEGALFLHFAANGSLGVIEEWLFSGCRMSPEELCTLLDRFVYLGRQGISTVPKDGIAS